MTQGFELFAKLGGDASGLTRALGNAQKSVDGTSGRLSKMQAVGVGAFKALAASAVAATASLAALTRSGLKAVDSQAKLARSIDGTVDGLRSVQIAAGDAGVDSGALGSSLQMLNARLAEAARGSGTAVKALDMLGLSARDLMLMDVDKRMAVIADRMREIGMSAGQAQDMLRQLGVRSREMSLLMIQGGDAIRNARQEVTSLGLSMTALDTAKVEQANDQMQRLGFLMDGVRQQFAVGMSASLTAISRMFVNSVGDAGRLADSVEQMMDRIVIGSLMTAEKVAEFLDPIKNAVSSLWEGFNALPAFVKEIGIVGAFILGKKKGAVLIGAASLIGKVSEVMKKQAAEIDEIIGQVQESDESFSLMRYFFGSEEEDRKELQNRFSRFRQDYAKEVAAVRKQAEEAAQKSAAALGKIGEELQEIVLKPREKLVASTDEELTELEQFGIQAARNMQTAFADFLFDPFKDGLKGMLRGFTDMLRRMLAELLARQLLLGFFGQFAGGTGIMAGIAKGFIGKQKGGPVNRNSPYMVGERGPEMMVPNASGTIVPNHKLGGGQSTSVTVNINAEDPGAEGRIRTMIERDMAPQIVQAAVGKTVGLFGRPSFA
jgi:hypothetical protein